MKMDVMKIWSGLLLCLSFLSEFVQGGKVPALYVFGDSTVDVGNNQYLPGNTALQLPYGIDFPHSRPTGRFSNGYNVADLVGMYALSTDGALELFASGCAFVLCDTLAQGIERADG